MRNDQQKVGDTTALTKIGSFIASMFKGTRAAEHPQAIRAFQPQYNEAPLLSKPAHGMPVDCADNRDEKLHETWCETTDRLIAEMPLTPDKFKPSPRFFTSWSQYKLIHALYIHHEVGRRELGEMVDIANIPDLVARANRRGWAIRCQRKGEVDVSGRCRYRGYYSLHEEDRILVRSTLYLAHLGYV